MSKIIEMARQAGFVAYGEDTGEYRIPTPAMHCRLERFAALVGAAERERCAQIVGAPHWKQAVRAELAKRSAAIRALGDEVRG